MVIKRNDRENISLRNGSFSLGEEDIFCELAERKGTSLFLGKYSLTEVVAVLGKKNFFKEARKRNLWPLDFALDSTDFPLQRFQIFFEKKSPGNLIVDLKLKEGSYTPPAPHVWPPVFSERRYLIIEWLTLQNPLQGFSEKRPPLPGQTHPGLGLGKKVLDIFIYLSRLTRKDGMLAFPAYFHNALLFSRYFNFVSPEKQAELQAIRIGFSSVPFKHLAWIAYLNCLKKNGRTYEWQAEAQVFPIHKALRSYFDSKKYKETLKESQKRLNFEIDWESYKKKMALPPEKRA